ncbi:uncharacterized protein cubi_00789 [Cryptosporidium ubiquitum]|uniref:Uncharacterized protein n=1 Tax=Cryptosporidium ubiquitum TaxID=857276 RepID=A0A1J4MD47_9CRYT|nr:uncharacterized protein cubi_00789 [Cryptosporidium ubiquitum]OII71411.1 hypothetical protein cubi_00789 [Cryptosporidium ubiquitum]
MSLLSYQKSQGTLGLGITEIENSTRKLVENETQKFEAYIDILKDQMVGMGELEHENEILHEEIARITEQLSLREMDMESKEKRIFELEKCVGDSQKMNKDYEKELNDLTKEKNDLKTHLNEMSIQLEKLIKESNTSTKEVIRGDDEEKNTSRSKSKKRTSEEHESENISANIASQEAPTLKKSRLRRPQNEDNSESKKSISKDAEPIIKDGKLGKEENPLKDVLGRTNLGRLRAPLLRSRVVKAAEAANPEVENLPELKTLEKEKSKPGKMKKSTTSVESKKSGKKTSKVAKIAKIPHYDENILNSMKVPELKNVCSKLQLEVNQRARKSDLIQSILSFQGE